MQVVRESTDRADNGEGNNFRGMDVSEESARGALAANVVEMARRKDQVYCPICGGDRMYRVERRGFLRRAIFPLVGYYPWQCKECANEAMLRKRNRKRRNHSSAA